jgi:predicted enzyme related to lactoylglutathione lyase
VISHSCVVHFEFPADNPEQVAEFYKNTLGWKIQKLEGPVDYWLISTGEDREPGIDGGIARKKDRPASGVLVTVRVDSVDASLKSIVSNGGSIVVPKRAIPGVGYQAHFRDPEGNVIGIMENDPLSTVRPGVCPRNHYKRPEIPL